MISSAHVTEVFINCLYKMNEIEPGVVPDDAVQVEGITSWYGFHPGRLQEATPKINSMLNELPEFFYGGASFLHLCQTKDGQLWTGVHKICEQLMLLAIAIGRMRYVLPSDQWSVFPGGMPYVKLRREDDGRFTYTYGVSNGI